MKRLLIVAMMLMLVLFAAACGGNSDGGAANPPAGGGSAAVKQLVVSLNSEPTSLDATQAQDFNTDRTCSDIYNQLVKFANDSMEIEPDLATEWDVSDDGLIYTFYLRDDVDFHDGTHFNAEAVKFNYDRQMDENSPYNSMGEFVYAYYMFEMVDKVEVVDEYTFRFYLTEPFAPFLAHLAMTQFSIVSPAAVEKYGRDFSMNPVGTGPFRFVSWTPGSEVILEKNPDYFLGPAKLDRIIFRPIKDDNVRQNELEAGTVDLMCDILPDNLAGLKANDKLQLLEQAGLHVWYLSMNCTKAPFDQREVRQAMYYAIDRQAIVDNILQGTGILAHNMVPPLTFAYTDDVPKYEYNPEKAKELLAQAGYADGFTIDFYIPESGSGMQQPVAMAVAMQSDLAKVGITVNLIQMEWGAYLDRVWLPTEEQDIVLMEMSYAADDGDPDNFLYALCSGRQVPQYGYNFAYWTNEEFDELVIKARTSLDENERVALYKEAQQLLMTEVPHLVIDHEIQMVAMKKNITGFQLHPRGLFRFYDVDIAN